ncbi:MmcQ/YjbR family DNA-binding protein [Christensenellaceae bacterium OttesenSCG-928-L17]|nr:MmcQ/YjbR family DNA-binding protein [Christensenellaceae bacterium OttesenSCG-928-L17]
MNRDDIMAYIAETFYTDPEYPWARTPRYAVFRHSHNKKWFAAIVDVTEDKLGLNGKKRVEALLLKCDPLLIGSLRNGRDILPGYHMNKEHWITVVLGGSLPAAQIQSLIDFSHELTK